MTPCLLGFREVKAFRHVDPGLISVMYLNFDYHAVQFLSFSMYFNQHDKFVYVQFSCWTAHVIRIKFTINLATCVTWQNSTLTPRKLLFASMSTNSCSLVATNLMHNLQALGVKYDYNLCFIWINLVSTSCIP